MTRTDRENAEAALSWTPVILLFIANVLFGAGLFSHAFLYNFYLDGLRHSETVMGLAAAALTAGGVTALLPAGIVVDRLGTKIALLAATLFATCGLVAGALAIRPLIIYAAAFLAGAGTATWRVAVGPIIMQLTAAGMRTRAFSWNVALLVGSGAVWTAASGILPGWLETAVQLDPVNAIRGGLILGAIGTAVSAGLFALVGDRGRPARADPVLPGVSRSPRRLLEGLAIPSTVAVLVVLVVVWMSAGGLVIPFFNIFFLRAHGLAVDRVGYILALSQALTAVVIFGSGEIATRLGPRRTLAVWMFLFAPTLWGLAAASAVGLAIVLFLIQGLVPPATNPLIDQILLEQAPEKQRGAVSSWRNGATDVSGLAGASAGGLILERGSFDTLFGVAGAVALLGAASLIIALRRLRDR